MNDREREIWVNNDEGLYNWWKDTKLAMRKFLRTYRTKIDTLIHNRSQTKGEGDGPCPS